MRYVFIILTIMLTSSCSSPPSKTVEDKLYEKVLTAINKNDREDLSEPDFDAISAYVAKGKSRWLSLYPQLGREPFSGMASFQEGLDISMAYALPENTTATLELVNKENIGKVCGIPFIEPTKKEVDDYYSKALKALESSVDDNQRRQACIAELNSSFLQLNNQL